MRGISGGEKRRLSIACGCVGAPRIIALDEPTSGLDANAALVVMQCMARLAGQQRIVISSIHQPRAAIWDLFTKVQVLSEGRMLYFGPTDQVRSPSFPNAVFSRDCCRAKTEEHAWKQTCQQRQIAVSEKGMHVEHGLKSAKELADTNSSVHGYCAARAS